MVSNVWIVHLARYKLLSRPDEDGCLALKDDVPRLGGTMALEEGDIAMGNDPCLECLEHVSIEILMLR